MALAETHHNAWRDAYDPRPEAEDRREDGGSPTSWSDAEPLGGELESWLEAFTGGERSSARLLEFLDAHRDEMPQRSKNHWQQ
jgi:hypothetical protein